jgi:hypothetical protein
MSTNAAPATIEIYAQAERRISQLLMSYLAHLAS